MSPQNIRKRYQIVRKDQDERVISGPVLIPDREDRHGDVVKADNIQEVAYKFLEEYGNVDLMHTFEDVGNVVESYLAPVDLEYDSLTVPKGSWMVSIRVTDDSIWEAVKRGDLTGFSIYGKGRRESLEGEDQ